jgi:hypothetical protein
LSFRHVYLLARGLKEDSWHEVFMFAVGAGSAHPGEPLMQVSTSQVFLNHLIDHRSKEAALFLTMFIIPIPEIQIVVVEYLPQGRIGELSGGWYTGEWTDIGNPHKALSFTF